ncbi:MAG: bestrophin family protein [Pseudanabaenaceae cyanobacterium]
MKSRSWLQSALRFRDSVIPAVLPRVVACGLFGEGVFLVEQTLGRDLSPEILSSVGFVLNLVLSLLLVFRTNTAYERFWEGRKAWGTLVNTTRNMARTIWIAVQETCHQDRLDKIAALKLLAAYAVAVKLHLRHSSIDPELRPFLPPAQFAKLQQMHHPPLEIAFWLGDYAQKQHQWGRLHVYLLNLIHEQINTLVDALGICERVQKTPIPAAYSIHLKQILLIYCVFLPFQIVDAFGWITGLATVMVTFVLLGIEEIAEEIEDPFGTDPNDLPLDQICHNINRNIEDLISLAPSTSVEVC